MKNNCKAFTILELAAIMFVLSITALIAVPNVGRSIDKYRLSCFESLIVSDIRSAQQQSSANWRQSKVCFNNTNREIYVQQGPKIIKCDHYPSSVKLDYTNFPNNRIDFNEFGNPSKGGSIHISCGKTKHTITVLPVTGRVKIYEYEKF